MRNVAEYYKAYRLIDPTLFTAGSTTGVAVQIIPNGEADAMAIVHVGSPFGAPTSTTVTVTVAGSATSGGTYTTLASFPVSNQGNQIGTIRVPINTALYGWIKATSVVGFTGGTSPSVAVAVSLISLRTVASSTNAGGLS